MLEEHERVVLLATGNGLKDVASATQAVGQARVVEPQLEAVEAVLGV
jgi:hypothetical protein